MDAVTGGQRYEVLGRVATTRTGAVWKARDVSLDRLVALKEIAAAERDTLYREAAAIAAIASEHVVAVYGVEESGPTLFLVEEWVDGATVAAVVRHNGRMPVAQALGVMRGALLGLSAAHRAGLVHGDVSVSNILVDARGEARLIDFGSVTTTGALARAATGAFAAPEVVAGLPVTPAADVYAAAAVLAGLLHGRVEGRPSTSGVDGPVRAVLDQALAERPEARYPDAGALLAALEAAATQAYGASWWTQAGLGAAAVASVAALVPAAAAIAGTGAAVAGAGALAGSGGAAGAGGGAVGATAAAGGTGSAVGGAGAVGGATGVGGASGVSGMGGASGVGGMGSGGASPSSATLASAHSGGSVVGKSIGRAAWHSRRALYGFGGVGVAVAAGITVAVASSGGSTPSASGTNIIRNPGAEASVANDQGTHVPTPDWTIAPGTFFTAAKYGADGLPASTDPGPKDRGKNLFTGGEEGDTSVGTQVDSLSAYSKAIAAGKAHFTLSAWLGGYSTQTDYAMLSITWQTSENATIGTPVTLGPVTATQRKDITELLQRSTSGTVPRNAAKVLVTLSMVREEGAYVDGYADNLSLVITS